MIGENWTTSPSIMYYWWKCLKKKENKAQKKSHHTYMPLIIDDVYCHNFQICDIWIFAQKKGTFFLISGKQSWQHCSGNEIRSNSEIKRST